MEFPTDRLYKFASFNENSLSALADQSVWFSDVDSLNDPFELSFEYVVSEKEEENIATFKDIGAKEIERSRSISTAHAKKMAEDIYIRDPDLFVKKMHEAIELIQSQQEKTLGKLNIFSTSLDVPEEPEHYKNMLMWAHYAVSFTGFCLQFSATKLLDSFRSHNLESKIGHCKVDYSDVTHKVNPFTYMNNTDESYFAPVQFKHLQWKYEGEFRFISSVRGLHKYSPDALERIYLGCKMPESKQKVILAIAKEYFPHVEVYKTSIDKTCYEIVTEKI
ncbi:DUF2971 domain-containing protein [Shewanella sp. 1CM18E]|uniref:DUF2971 domain-containing protein n=1 Tax=Shewanella sp. 1CM18E TaxID=2929169 RepID=UPI0020C02188|nr:DUF2971 domain-containing protein [Shewanella sp. 1CM18E]MCK8043997.1 DUF2971 domain-containing protein [Shewanella sp. 1CM18E]